jgi:hypothetical protein
MEKDIAIELIKIIPSFAWPLSLLVIVLLFKKDIKKIFSRIKRGSLFGNDFILEEEVEKLTESVEKEKLPLKNTKDVIENNTYKNENPIGKLIFISSIIEKELRHIMYKSGWFNNLRTGSIKNTINFLVSNESLPRNILSSVDLFMEIRNKVVHGIESIENEQIERVINIGLIILDQIRSIPLADHIIEYPHIKLYSDNECKNPINNVIGVMIIDKTTKSNNQTIHIFPTNREYKKGESVSWEWDLSIVYSDAFYKHPKSNEILRAWNSSGLFIGRNIEEI